MLFFLTLLKYDKAGCTWVLELGLFQGNFAALRFKTDESPWHLCCNLPFLRGEAVQFF
jgi:hypothetical protein